MMLTPLAPADIPALLISFCDACPPGSLARACADRIAATWALVHGPGLALSVDPDHHAAGVALVRRFGLGVIDGLPQGGFTWDGVAVRADMEPSVLIHEVGHWQVCAPARRGLKDFGLGAGPETGDKGAADAAMCLFGVAREYEEALASLLGILWEAELDQPAVLAFLEQNWLEGGAAPHNIAHFTRALDVLRRMGVIDAAGHPTTALRTWDDEVDLLTLPEDAGRLATV